MAFEDLTWEDLEDWAGPKVLGRGRSYRCNVEDLRITPDGRLLAWVRGGSRYAALVSLDASDGLGSVCTCPYGIACKHAVAMVLAYLDTVQAGGTVPAAAADDRRLRLLECDTDEGDAEEIDEDGDACGDEEEPSPVSTAKSGGKRRSGRKTENAVQGYLESLSHKDLLAFAGELADADPDVRERILDRARLKSGSVAKLVASIRHEIEEVASEPAWADYWSGESAIPDYSRIGERLHALLAAGHADEVVELGGTLLECGNRQIEMSHEEGETGEEIAGCMDVVFRALKVSGRPGAERLMWEIDARLDDGYGILEGVKGVLGGRAAFSRADWSAAADILAERMESIHVEVKADGNEYRSEYRRKEVMRWLIEALGHAGHPDEITALLVREAPVTRCYTELVDHLLAVKAVDKAEEWARNGFEEIRGELRGVAWALEERLRMIAWKRKDLPMVAAYRVLEFFDRPDESRYSEVRKTVEPLGVWEAVRSKLLAWLETGVRPDLAQTGPAPTRGKPDAPCRKDGRRRKDRSAVWPLPSTGLCLAEEKQWPRRSPDTETLIDIAITEKRNDDVLRWYRHDRKNAGLGMDRKGGAVADAVQTTHPDEALAIWKSLASAQIAIKNPSAYREAGAFLKKMQAVYKRLDRQAEWKALLAGLRAEHARKRRLMETLDRLEGKRTRIIER